MRKLYITWLHYYFLESQALCSQFPPIRVSMRSRLRWRSLCTMKSSRERMRKDEMQLTISLIPLAIESNRLFPSGEKREEKRQNTSITRCTLLCAPEYEKDTVLLPSSERNSVFYVWKQNNLEQAKLNFYFKIICWISLAHSVKKCPVSERDSKKLPQVKINKILVFCSFVRSSTLCKPPRINTFYAIHIFCSCRSTWVEAGELAALFGILAEVLAALRTLTQRSHTHLRLSVMTRAAQTRVVPFRGEVVALVNDVVFYIHTRLPCWEKLT